MSDAKPPSRLSAASKFFRRLTRLVVYTPIIPFVWLWSERNYLYEAARVVGCFFLAPFMLWWESLGFLRNAAYTAITGRNHPDSYGAYLERRAGG